MDSIIVGLTPLSCFQAISQIRQNKKIMLLDPLVNPNEMNLNTVSSFEKELIQNMFPEMDNRFFKFEQLEFRSLQWRFRTTNNLHINLHEFLRVFGSQLNFNLDLCLNKPSDELCADIDNERKLLELAILKSRQFSTKINYSIEKEWLRDLVHSIFKLLHSEEGAKSNVSQFFSLASFFATGVVRYRHDEVDILYLLFKVLYPCYNLVFKEFYPNILQSFEKDGGIFREATIEEWQFHDQKLERVMLNTFDGVFSPKNVYLHFFPDEQFPVSLETDVDFFHSYVTHYHHVNKPDFKDIQNESLVFYTHPFTSGTDFPAGALRNDEAISNLNLYPKKLGTKSDFFYQSDVAYQEDVFDNLSQIKSTASQKMTKSSSHIFLDERHEDADKRKHLTQERLFIFKEKSSSRTVIGLSYAGIFQYYQFGLWGHLLTIPPSKSSKML